MGMTVGGGDDDGGLNSEINITPFVDVMLVLLVIFMVTTPLINKAAEMDLPETNLTKTADGKEQIIKIDRFGKLSVGGIDTNYQNLAETLKNDDRIKKLGVVNIEAHANIPYIYVFRAMEIANNAGVTKVLLAGTEGDVKDLKKLDEGVETPRVE